MENRYIDPETGKFKDSKVSEITGGVAGGLAGSLGINALRSYQGFKQELQEHEELNHELPSMRADQARVNQALGDAELLQQMRQNPQALADLSPEMQDHFSQVYDVAERLQGRSDFDKVHELPMKERLQRFIKGKPSLEGIDPELIEYVSGRYGARPFDPEVVDVLRQQAGEMGQDLDMFTEFAGQRPRFNMKNAIPTLEHYKPKQLLQTVKHPLVTGGAMLGVGAGMMADEYRRHLSNIAEREMQKEAGFSSVFKKLLPKKPPAPAGPPPVPKKPLIPKAVKRTGLVLGAAGVGGYMAVKAKDDFAAGTKLAPSAQQSEGMDMNMNKQAELYAELQKVAFDGGSDDYWQAYADQSNRGPVKRAVDGAHEVGVNIAEGARGLAGRVPNGVAKGLGIGAGVAGLAGAGYGGYQLYQGQQVDDIQKVAFDGGSDDYWQAYADQSNRGPVKRAVDGAHEVGVNIAEGARGLAGRVPNGVAKGLGIGAGVAGLAGAGYGGYQLYQGQEEQTAASLYAELEKEALTLKGVKDGLNTFGNSTKDAFSSAGSTIKSKSSEFAEKTKSTAGNFKTKAGEFADKTKSKASQFKTDVVGKEAKGLEQQLADNAKLEPGRGLMPKRLNILQEQATAARKTTNKARGQAALAGAGVGAVGAGAGVMALRKDEEKTAAELYAELMKEAGFGDAVAKAGNAIKSGAGVLAGSKGKGIQSLSNDLARNGRLTAERATKLQGKADAANSLTNKARIGVGAGLALGGASYAGGKMAGQREKTASEQEQGHPYATGAAIGTGAGALAGAGGGALGLSRAFDVAAHNPDMLSAERAKALQELYADYAPDLPIAEANQKIHKLFRNVGGIGGGVAGGALGLGAGLAGGGIAAALANRNQEKTASEQEGAYQEKEPTKGMVVDHAIDGAKRGAGLWGGMGALSGGLAGLRMTGAPIGWRVASPIGGGVAGASLGAMQGGAIGTVAGLGARHNQEQHYEAAQAALENGETPAAPGQADKGVVIDQALKGAGIGAGVLGGLGALAGGAGGLALKNSSKGLRAGLPIGGAVLGGMVGAGHGGLIGAASGSGAYLNEKRRHEEAEQLASNETHDIEKIASESINALFGESTDAILNDKLEKIAGYTDPMERITFGYENLKK